MFELIELLLIMAIVFIGGIMVLAAVVFCIWLYAAYKWIKSVSSNGLRPTRKKWEGKTPRGNRRV